MCKLALIFHSLAISPAIPAVPTLEIKVNIIHLSIHLSVHLSIRLSVHPSVCLSIRPSNLMVTYESLFFCRFPPDSVRRPQEVIKVSIVFAVPIKLLVSCCGGGQTHAPPTEVNQSIASVFNATTMTSARFRRTGRTGRTLAPGGFKCESETGDAIVVDDILSPSTQLQEKQE